MDSYKYEKKVYNIAYIISLLIMISGILLEVGFLLYVWLLSLQYPPAIELLLFIPYAPIFIFGYPDRDAMYDYNSYPTKIILVFWGLWVFSICLIFRINILRKTIDPKIYRNPYRIMFDFRRDPYKELLNFYKNNKD